MPYGSVQPRSQLLTAAAYLAIDPYFPPPPQHTGTTHTHGATEPPYANRPPHPQSEAVTMRRGVGVVGSSGLLPLAVVAALLLPRYVCMCVMG